MSKATLRNFHVPLPEALYDRLRKEAEQSEEPATEIAKYAIEEYLEKRRKDVLYSAIPRHLPADRISSACLRAFSKGSSLIPISSVSSRSPVSGK